MKLFKKLLISMICLVGIVSTSVYADEKINFSVKEVNEKETYYSILDITGIKDIIYVYTSSSSTTAYTYILGKPGTGSPDVFYLGEEGNRYRIKVSGITGWIDKSSIINKINEPQVMSYYIINNGKLIRYTPTSFNTNASYYTRILGPINIPGLEENVKYYSYDGNYFYNNRTKMTEDYLNSNTNVYKENGQIVSQEIHSGAINKENPYYNYYQYLPLRSKTTYTGSDLDRFLKNNVSNYSSSKLDNQGDSFISSQEKYGINALIMYALSSQETGYGKSSLAIDRNAMFSIGAYDSSPGSAEGYLTVQDSIDKFANVYASKGYLDVTDSRYFGGFVGNKLSGMNVKYASDPYWGEKIAAIMYKIDSYLGLKDYEYYQIAIKDTYVDEALYKNSTGYDVSYYMQNSYKNSNGYVGGERFLVAKMPLILVSENNSRYQVQSDTILRDDKTILNYYELSADGPIYNFARDRLYVNKNSVIKVNRTKFTYNYPEKINSEIIYDSLYTNIYFRIKDDNTDVFEDVRLQNKKESLSKNKSVKILRRGYSSDGTANSYQIEYDNKTAWVAIDKVYYDSDNSDIKYTSYESEYIFYSLNYNKDTKTIETSGNISVKNINDINKYPYVIEIVFTNIDTKETYSYKLDKWTENYPYDLGEKNYGWFKGTFKMDNIKQGDYTANIRIRAGNIESTAILRNVFSKEMARKITTENKKGILFRTNYYLKTLPIEIFVRDEGLIDNTIQPTQDNMFNSQSKIEFKESTLHIRGTSYSVGGDYSTKSDVKREIILENTKTFKRYTFTSNYIDNGDFKVVLRLSDGLDKTRAWFDTNIDISKLEVGTYLIYIKTTAGNKVSDYGELVDLFYNVNSNIKTEYGDKKAKLNLNTGKRNRIELIIENKS